MGDMKAMMMGQLQAANVYEDGQPSNSPGAKKRGTVADVRKTGAAMAQFGGSPRNRQSPKRQTTKG